eukprot:CAMPEP_0170605456 /NCGR_PEP_ID=MMETSP0224-20130122/19983_1 /TAXON_ID=285029 /ORGANISM="Togula jolla, Strain CCCM 725" /LENGTH=492 /DNA_ID=CAMNT_0010930461 /DNA_START=1 /DNA_END=1475 /DNA_ORIENTATION=+
MHALHASRLARSRCAKALLTHRSSALPCHFGAQSCPGTWSRALSAGAGARSPDSGAAPDPAAAAAEPSESSDRASGSRWALAATATAAVGGLTALALWLNGSGGPVSRRADLHPISEQIFDTADNLFVFFLSSEAELEERRHEIQRVIDAVASQEGLHRLRYHVNVIKDGDPPVPEGAGPPEGSEAASAPQLRVVMYKGQRKSVLRLSSTPVVKEQLDQVLAFFSPLVEELRESDRQPPIPKISGRDFATDVIAASSPTAPVLLQMFEDTCFLCFLMRPFMQSLALLLAERQVPLSIRRMNLERNDFPDGCPVARGTPTFVLFRGPTVKPEKLEAFKPKDLCDQLAEEFPVLAGEALERMDYLQSLVSRRFQLFTQLVMWTVEIQRMEQIYNSSGILPLTGDREKEDNVSFNYHVANMMATDMRRTDGIEDNLRSLQADIDEAEHDAVILGALLAEAVLQGERADQEALEARRLGVAEPELAQAAQGNGCGR